MEIRGLPCSRCGNNDYKYMGIVLSIAHPLRYKYQCKECGGFRLPNKERMDIADSLGIQYIEVTDDVVADYRAAHPAGPG